MKPGYAVAAVNEGDEHFTQYRCVLPGCSWVSGRVDHAGNPNAVSEAMEQTHEHSRTAHPVEIPDTDPYDDWSDR